jgi:hypothetical protein
MQEGNEMAFKLAGGDHDPKRYQRIRDALEASIPHQAKLNQADPILTAAGTAYRGASPEFEDVGIDASFKQSVEDPAARPYFDNFANSLLNFRDAFG